MRTLVIVELKIVCQGCPKRLHKRVFIEINQLILEAAPQSLDKDIVYGAAFTVHADADLGLQQSLSKVGAGELAALVGIKDFRLIEV